MVALVNAVKNLQVPSLADDLLASQGGFCAIDLISYF